MGKVRSEVGVFSENTRFPASRRPKFIRTPAESAHIRQIGEIVHAWNHAHGELFHVFSVLVADDDIILAHALWHSIQNDKGQRAMAAAVAKVKIPNPSNQLRQSILWAVTALDKLGTHRNDAAHAEIIQGHPDVTAALSVKTATSERLETSPVSKYWRIMRGDVYAITNYLHAIYLALWRGWSRPLSYRPRLLFVQIANPKNEAKRRQAKKQSRERQRQASRP
jgi:hypothetical protein